MSDEASQRAGVGAQRGVRRLKVLLQKQVAQRIDRVLVAHDGDLGNRVALVLVVVGLLEVREPDVLPALTARCHLAAQLLPRLSRAESGHDAFGSSGM